MKLKFKRNTSCHREYNDCAIVAISIATKTSYRRVAWLLKLFGRKARCGTTAKIELKAIKMLVPECRVNKGYWRLNQLCRLNPKGTFIFDTYDHAFVYKDGVIHDYFNKPYRIVRKIYKVSD